MQWIFRCCSESADLASWEARPFWPGVERGPGPADRRDRHERVVAREAPGPPHAGGICPRLAEAIFRFDVFPPALVTPVLRRAPVEVGDTAGILCHFMPGLDLFFAARVTERFEEERAGLWRCGFTYRTLVGHPACGEETFSVEKDLQTGDITVALRSWSRPGLWSARLARPVMRLLQARAGRGALVHLGDLARRAEGSRTA